MDTGGLSEVRERSNNHRSLITKSALAKTNDVFNLHVMISHPDIRRSGNGVNLSETPFANPRDQHRQQQICGRIGSGPHRGQVCLNLREHSS